MFNYIIFIHSLACNHAISDDDIRPVLANLNDSISNKFDQFSLSHVLQIDPQVTIFCLVSFLFIKLDISKCIYYLVLLFLNIILAICFVRMQVRFCPIPDCGYAVICSGTLIITCEYLLLFYIYDNYFLFIYNITFHCYYSSTFSTALFYIFIF